MTHASLISRKDIVMIPFEGRLLPTSPHIITEQSCSFLRNVLQFHLCAIIRVSVSHKIATITLTNCISYIDETPRACNTTALLASQ